MVFCELTLLYKWTVHVLLLIKGRGSFGLVELVKHKPTGNTYALKGVSKAQIVNTGQQEHIISEKKVMSMLDSQFMVKL